MTFISKFIADESGATAIEYGLVVALVSLGVIAGATILGNTVANTFNYTATSIETANSGAFSN